MKKIQIENEKIENSHLGKSEMKKDYIVKSNQFKYYN